MLEGRTAVVIDSTVTQWDGVKLADPCKKRLISFEFDEFADDAEGEEFESMPQHIFKVVLSTTIAFRSLSPIRSQDSMEGA